MLGNLRLTMDIDFWGDDIPPSELHQSIIQVAKELQICVEPVALERFIPLPADSDKRSIDRGQFGNLKVFVADPYSIALSKVDRGSDTDLDDLVFLVQTNFVEMESFERMVQDALPLAQKFDFHPDMLEHLQELKNRLGQ